MTEIEKQALALVNEVRAEHGGHPNGIIAKNTYAWDALCRAIEQHEAFKREMSERDERLGEALYGLSARLLLAGFFENKEDHAVYERVVEVFGKPFVLPKPVDPLVEAIDEIWEYAKGCEHVPVMRADQLRAALAKRGLEVREIEG